MKKTLKRSIENTDQKVIKRRTQNNLQGLYSISPFITAFITPQKFLLWPAKSSSSINVCEMLANNSSLVVARANSIQTRFIILNTSSIGLKSGEYVGKNFV